MPSSLPPSDRIRIKGRIADALQERDEVDIDLILREYGLPVGRGWGDERTTREYIFDCLVPADDTTLIGLEEFVSPAQPPFPARMGPWKTEGIRLFMSHTHHHREFVSEVGAALNYWGVEAFVAHADIEPTTEWMMAMEAALRSCHGLAAFLHDEFPGSKWCDQEVGVAYARQIVLIPVRMRGNNPHGFLGKYQALAGDGRTPHELAEAIFDCLESSEALAELIVDALLVGLERSFSYADAKDKARRLQTHSFQWNPARLDRLRSAMENRQVYEAHGVGEWAEGVLQVHTPPGPPSPGDVPF